MQGSYSYQESKGDAGQKGVIPASDKMLKLGLAYQSQSGYNLGLWYNYFGYISRLESINSSVNVVNPEADAVNFLSFNLALNMGEFLSSDEWYNVEISINANNLLNKNLMFAELSRRAVNTPAIAK